MSDSDSLNDCRGKKKAKFLVRAKNKHHATFRRKKADPEVKDSCQGIGDGIVHALSGFLGGKIRCVVVPKFVLAEAGGLRQDVERICVTGVTLLKK